MRIMKKLLALLLLLIFTTATTFCATVEQEPTTVFGILGQVAEFIVSLNYGDNYAFSLDVGNEKAAFIEPQPSATMTNRTGYRVANWGFVCNTPVKITIGHNKLTNEFNPSAEYQIEYELGVQKSSNEFGFILSTETLELSYPMTSNEPIHFDNYGLYVRLTKSLSELVDYPEGFYYSTISFNATTLN